MKRIFVIIFCFLSGVIFSQKKELLSKIDSIAQQQWNAATLNIDSLANPVFEKLSTKFNDTILTHNNIIIPQVREEIPLTPFNLIKGTEKNWFFFGQNNLVFNQSSFANWISGGNDNIGVLGKVNYNIIYKYRKHYLENIVQMGYGFVSTDNQASRKTEDYLNLMTNYGYELGKNYYLSTGLQFRTQFTPGYNYTDTPDPAFSDRTSRFMAPAYLNLGIGISYNPKENFQVIFRPVSGKFTFVLDPKLQTVGRFGLERDGQSIRTELGVMLNILYRLKISKGVNFDNQLNFFTNYLDHTERVDVAYNGNLNIRFNKFISTIITMDMVYDHDQIAKLQRKQTLSVGLSYNLGQNLDKEKSSKLLKPIGAK